MQNSFQLNKNGETLTLSVNNQKRGQKRLSYRLDADSQSIPKLVKFLGDKVALAVLKQRIHTRVDHMIHYEHKTIQEVIKTMEYGHHSGVTKAELMEELMDAIKNGDILLAQKLQKEADMLSRNTKPRTSKAPAKR